MTARGGRIADLDLPELPGDTRFSEVLSLPLAAERLGLPAETVYRAARAGRLPAFRAPSVSQVVVLVADLERFKDTLRRYPRREGRVVQPGGA